MKKVMALVLIAVFMATPVFATESKEEPSGEPSVLIVKKVGIYKGKGTKASFIGVRKKYQKTIRKKNVPVKVRHKGKTYRVTSVGKNAFKGCKKIKNVYFHSKKALKIAKNAIPGGATVHLKARGKQYRLMKKNLRKSGFKGKIRKF